MSGRGPSARSRGGSLRVETARVADDRHSPSRPVVGVRSPCARSVRALDARSARRIRPTRQGKSVGAAGVVSALELNLDACGHLRANVVLDDFDWEVGLDREVGERGPCFGQSSDRAG